MADGSDAVTIKTCPSIAEIGRDVWDGLAAATGEAFNPFVAYDFLHALETSKSACAEAGWAPLHLVMEQNGDVAGVMPCYVKSHSQGEYIFDHHWADAYERAGGRYYPKLLCAAPFTPAAGPRLLADGRQARRALASGARQASDQIGLSSAHVNFLTDVDAAALGEAGFLRRQGVQYHWFNRGYERFDDFLGALASRKRKTIRRERRDALANDITIDRLVGDDIEERHWDAFWLFYQDTGARKWGRPYLTRSFFRRIAETMKDSLMMVVAERGGAPIAGALNFIGGDTLYGRYWGCAETHPFLHFEVCYHQAIDFAIERGLSRIEAGAQGEHKIARGYDPVATYSAHWIRDDGFRDAIARYLDAEKNQGDAEIDVLSSYSPYKKS
ncbi:MAG: GNAT family N-acetyltransferase [Pseudomonadota bacterium]